MSLEQSVQDLAVTVMSYTIFHHQPVDRASEPVLVVSLTDKSQCGSLNSEATDAREQLPQEKVLRLYKGLRGCLQDSEQRLHPCLELFSLANRHGPGRQMGHKDICPAGTGHSQHSHVRTHGAWLVSLRS